MQRASSPATDASAVRGSKRRCGTCANARWKRVPPATSNWRARSWRAERAGMAAMTGRGIRGPSVLPIILAAVLALVPPPAAALQVEVADALSAGEAAATRVLIDDALLSLPPRWREQQATLQLAWRNDLPGHVHGRIRGDRITLSRELLEGMLAPAGSSAATAAHATEAADVAPRQRNGARASPQRAAVAT